MARGRFIAKEICIDKTVNDLNDPWSMLAFTWLITHADCEGRTYGDPAIVKSLVFPRRTDITIEQIESYIQSWHEKGLITLYEVDGDLFIEFPNFDKHQPGLVKTKEAVSHIPAIPTPEEIQSNSRVNQAHIKVKLSQSLSKGEVKVSDSGGDTRETEKIIALNQQLTDYFCEKTQIKPLNKSSPKIRWEWWEPIGEMLDAFELDLEKTKQHLDKSIIRADERKLTYSNPKGLLSTFQAIIAEQKRGADKPKIKTGFAGVLEKLEKGAST